MVGTKLCVEAEKEARLCRPYESRLRFLERRKITFAIKKLVLCCLKMVVDLEKYFESVNFLPLVLLLLQQLMDQKGLDCDLFSGCTLKLAFVRTPYAWILVAWIKMTFNSVR
jgi:hypothetical protein